MNKLTKILRHYGSKSLIEEHCPEEPFALFHEWIDNAIAEETYEPNAMVLSTIDKQNKPHSRIVLLKEIYNQSLVFYTNFDSDKAFEMAHNPQVSLLFWWPTTERQVRIDGVIEKAPENLSDNYFASRDKASQLAALASPQSQKIESRDTLEEKFHALQEQFTDVDKIPRPQNWGGYLVKPELFEFWQGGNHRLHDRICYKKHGDFWKKFRKAP